MWYHIKVLGEIMTEIMLSTLFVKEPGISLR